MALPEGFYILSSRALFVPVLLGRPFIMCGRPVWLNRKYCLTVWLSPSFMSQTFTSRKKRIVMRRENKPTRPTLLTGFFSKVCADPLTPLKNIKYSRAGRSASSLKSLRTLLFALHSSVTYLTHLGDMAMVRIFRITSS